MTLTPWYKPMSAAILVIAPHPDDEAIGGGGLLLSHALSGGETGVLYLTFSNQARRLEAEAVRAELGIKNAWELGLKEGNVQSTPRAREELAELLRSYRPQTILIPSPHDRHPDHRNAHALLRDALLATPCLPSEVVFYEGFTPIGEPNAWFDITAVADRKWRALTLYESQERRYRLVELVRHLNAYRALTTMRVAVHFAEVFRSLAVSEYLRDCDGCEKTTTPYMSMYPGAIRQMGL